ncbi:MAG: hypothetical protein ACO24Y_02175 [Hylemonella sp.]
MRCPYCQSDIDDEALVCKICKRDIYLFKPLLAKIAALEEQVQGLSEHEADKARIRQLESQLADVREQLFKPPVGAPGIALALATYILLPLGLLLLAHAIITIVLDTNLLYLRVISIALPLPFGLMLMRRAQRSILLWFVGTMILAVASVIGMSWITSLVDQTPVLPKDAFEWREYLEYAASISLSFLTGMLIGSVSYARAHRLPAKTGGRGSLAQTMLSRVLGANLSPAQINEIMKKLNDYGSSAVALGTTALSIYTGLKGFMGK